MKKRVRKERERKRWEGVEGIDLNRVKKEEIFFHIILGMKKKLKKKKKIMKIMI